MFDYLVDLPNVVLFLVIMSLGLLLAVGLPVLIRWKFKITPNDALSKGATEAYKIAISITLLLFVITLVRVQGDHRNAEDIAAKEVALTLKLTGALAVFGGPDAEESVEDLKAYTKSVANDEWPLMAKGVSSDVTTGLLADLTQGIGLLTPENAKQQMARVEIGLTISQLTDTRQARLTAAKVTLPNYLTQAITCALALVIILGWLETPLPRLAGYAGGVVTGFSVLLTLLIQASGVFVGQNAVDAWSIPGW
jgi:hypothetical protein